MAAEYREFFLLELSKRVNLKLIRGVSTGPSDVIDANITSDINILSFVRYFVNGRIWYHQRIKKRLITNQPDFVIVSPTIRDLSNFIIFFNRKSLGYKMVGWGMGEMPGRSGGKKVIHRFLQWVVVKSLDGMIVYSSTAHEYYRKVLGFTGPIEIAHNAVDLSDFKLTKNNFSPQKYFTLVYVGRITPDKKLDELIKVVTKSDNLKLRVIGSGEKNYLSDLKRLIGKSGHRIYFEGPLFGANLNRSLTECDLFVLPSRGGLAINHAMASGVPVLVSKGDGTEADLIIENKTGFLFEEGDYETMADLIQKLVSEPNLRKYVAINGAKHVRENFTVKKMCDVFAKHFEELT